MGITQAILDTLPDGVVRDVRIGLHWTAAVVEVEGEVRCGLAATLRRQGGHELGPAVPRAGELESYSGRELADLALAPEPELSSVGVAALNALAPRNPRAWREGNAEEILARLGKQKRVALVGHFPFVQRLRPRLGSLDVIERDPREGDHPESAAPEILPHADVVAITGMAFVNHSLEGLLELCSPESTIMVLGPSTPLSSVLLDASVALISGSIVTDIDRVLRAVSQGAGFHQVHQAGVRLVTLARSGFEAVLA